MTGYVRKIIIDKGYGFISVKETNDDFFFHRDDCIPGTWDELCNIDSNSIEVEFEADYTPKGPRARLVTRV